MITIDEWIINLIDSQLESIQLSEDCPVCGATDTRLIWHEDCAVAFQCQECESDWWATGVSINDVGQPVRVGPRVLDVLE